MFWKSKKPQLETPITAAQQLEIAQRAFQQGDDRHAVEHLAYALADDPENATAQALLDRIITNHRTPFELVEWKKPPVPYAIAAVRAYIHTKYNQAGEAFSLMDQIFKVLPGFPFLPWLVNWFEDTSLLNQAGTSNLILLVTEIGSQVTNQMDKGKRELLQKLLPPLRTYRQTHEQNLYLNMVMSILFRKLGHLDEALELALAAHVAEPQYFTANVLGNAYRDRDQIEQAVAAYREALAYNPEEKAIRLDLGDVLCENGQLEAGLTAYQEVLDREPQHPWAYPSYLYYKAITDPTGSWNQQLTEYTKKHPDNERAVKLSKERDPYFISLPGPNEAIINIARQVIAEAKNLPLSLVLEVSSLEAPSAVRALQLLQLQQHGKTTLNIKVGEIQQPDPRFPRGEVDFILWKYAGTAAEPNLPEPNPAVAAVVGQLASSFYEANAWWVQAADYAQPLGVNALNDLLSTMLYPPPGPPQFPLWVWLERVQIAAAFIIARLDSGWDNSVRRKALLSLARGPMDWTVGAAILALAMVIIKDKVGHTEIDLLYYELLKDLPRPGGVPYEQPLLLCAIKINPSPKLKKLLLEIIKGQ